MGTRAQMFFPPAKFLKIDECGISGKTIHHWHSLNYVPSAGMLVAFQFFKIVDVQRLQVRPSRIYTVVVFPYFPVKKLPENEKEYKSMESWEFSENSRETSGIFA
jgi:hypothetical protein